MKHTLVTELMMKENNKNSAQVDCFKSQKKNGVEVGFLTTAIPMAIKRNKTDSRNWIEPNEKTLETLLGINYKGRFHSHKYG